MRSEDPRESTKRYFRADKRIIVMDGQWFYSTREGERGPFPTQKKAESEVKRFKEEMSDLQNFQKNRETATKNSALQLQGVPVPTRDRGKVIRSRRESVSQTKLREVLI